MKKLFDLTLITLGFVLLSYGGYLLLLRHRPIVPVQATEGTIQERVTAQPTKLAITSLSLTLPVYPSEIVGDKWQTTDQGISYLATSPLPGEVGNTVMYGHNWPNILGGLSRIKPGDTINIYFGSKKVEYRVHYVSIVEPDNTSVYTNTTDSRLTLYTCTGFLDSKRLVVTAFPAS